MIYLGLKHSGFLGKQDVTPINTEESALITTALTKGRANYPELVAEIEKSPDLQRRLVDLKFNLGNFHNFYGEGWGSFKTTCPKVDFETYVGLRDNYNIISLKGANITFEEFMIRMSKYRREGLPIRADGGWLQGQLTDAQFNILREEARKRGQPIYICGSLSETNYGLYGRYTIDKQGFLPNWRQTKPHSDLIDIGKGDFDIWAGSNMSFEERKALAIKLGIVDPSLDDKELMKILDDGYSLDDYQSPGDLSTKNGGTLAFNPDGTVTRYAAPWQEVGWPKPGTEPRYYLSKTGVEIRYEQWLEQQKARWNVGIWGELFPL